jgi:hypothetical protein
VGKPQRVVKRERYPPRKFLRAPVTEPLAVAELATTLLGIVSFLLTPQEWRRRIPATFSVGFRSRGPGQVRAGLHGRLRAFWVNGKNSASFQRGKKACSICRVGQCNALIRSARLVATGCGRPTPEESCAAIAPLRFTMCRRRWGRACGCVPARWAAIVRRAGRPDVSGNCRDRPRGPARPVPPGRAVPAILFLGLPLSQAINTLLKSVACLRNHGSAYRA